MPARQLELQPACANARLNLGIIRVVRGEFHEAERDFRSALQVQPTLAQAQVSLAMLLRRALPETDLVALERLPDASLDPDLRSQCLFALAHVWDAHGDYRRAGGDPARGERSTPGVEPREPSLSSRRTRAVRRPPDPRIRSRVFPPCADAGNQSCRPVFIVGLPRSGTTLVEQVLASHSRIHGAGELYLGATSLQIVSDSVGGLDKPVNWDALLRTRRLANIAQRHLDQLLALDGGRASSISEQDARQLPVLGTARRTISPGDVHSLSPPASRRGRLVLDDRLQRIRWTNDFSHIACRFAQYVRLMEHWHTTLPVTIHEVNYEQFVAGHEPLARHWWRPAVSTGSPLVSISIAPSTRKLRQRHAGPPTDLHALRLALEKLRARTGRVVRRTPRRLTARAAKSNRPTAPAMRAETSISDCTAVESRPSRPHAADLTSQASRLKPPFTAGIASTSTPSSHNLSPAARGSPGGRRSFDVGRSAV